MELRAGGASFAAGVCAIPAAWKDAECHVCRSWTPWLVLTLNLNPHAQVPVLSHEWRERGRSGMSAVRRAGGAGAGRHEWCSTLNLSPHTQVPVLSHECASAGGLLGALRAVWAAPELDAAGGALLDFRGFRVPRKAWRLANGVGVGVQADAQTGERWERTKALVRPRRVRL